MNAPEFWAVRKEFMDKYGVDVRRASTSRRPTDPAAREAQARANFETALSVLRTNTALTD